jgi:hypothetical protein
MRGGRCLAAAPPLADIRAYVCRQLDRLPLDLRALRPQVSYPVQVSSALERLAAIADWRMSLGELQR